MGSTASRHVQIDTAHGLLECLSVFSFLDGLEIRTDHLHTKALKHSPLGRLNSSIKGCLSADCGEYGIRSFFGHDLFNNLPCDRFNIGLVGHFRVRHNGSRVGIKQYGIIALFHQCPTGLGAGIIKFASLTNNNRPGTDDKYFFDIVSFWHGYSN